MTFKLTTIIVPIFEPKYEKSMQYGYENLKGDNLTSLLYKTSNGYCMYCYCRILIDSKKFGHVEHAIEKMHSVNKLTNCVPNIGLACPICNTSFKSKGEKLVSFNKELIDEFNAHNCVSQAECKKECISYKKLKRFYLKQRKILLQPMGITVNGRKYRIQFNVLKLMFEPSDNTTYNAKDIKFIKEHIDRFNLNDAKYRTKELLKFCKDYTDGTATLEKNRYNNYIVDLFIDKLIGLNDKKKTDKLCKMIFAIGRRKGII